MGGLGWGDAMMTFFSGNGEAPCELYWALRCLWKVNNTEWLFRYTTTQEQDWGVELLFRNMHAHTAPKERTYWGSTAPPALQKHLAHSSHPTWAVADEAGLSLDQFLSVRSLNLGKLSNLPNIQLTVSAVGISLVYLFGSEKKKKKTQRLNAVPQVLCSCFWLADCLER